MTASSDGVCNQDARCKSDFYSHTAQSTWNATKGDITRLSLEDAGSRSEVLTIQGIMLIMSHDALQSCHEDVPN